MLLTLIGCDSYDNNAYFTDEEKNANYISQEEKDISEGYGDELKQLDLLQEDESSLTRVFQKRISDRLPEFTFYIRFENYAPTSLGGYISKGYRMESIVIIGANGEMLQELRDFDREFLFFDTIPTRRVEDWWRKYPCDVSPYGLSFVDVNFDGYLDLVLPRFIEPNNSLRFAFGNFHNFLWDSQLNKFVLNQQLIELEDFGFWQAIVTFSSSEYDENRDMMGSSGIRLDEEEEILVFVSFLNGNWAYFPPFGHHIDQWAVKQHYQYRDGKFELVRMQERIYDDIEGTWQIRVLDDMMGTVAVDYIKIVPWMAAYAELLREYVYKYQHYSGNVDFIIHDMDEDGTPELIIRLPWREGESHSTFVYSIRETNQVRRIGNLNVDVDHSSLFVHETLPGIFEEILEGHGAFHQMYRQRVIIGDSLTDGIMGNFFIDLYGAEGWFIDGEEVSQEEFNRVFGSSRMAWLRWNRATEENIQELIFEWR